MGARCWARRLLSRHSGILPSSPARARVSSGEMEDGQRRGGCNAMAVALWQWRVETELRVRERAGTRMPARERDKGEQQKRRDGTGTAAREDREKGICRCCCHCCVLSPCRRARSCSLVAILGSLPRPPWVGRGEGTARYRYTRIICQSKKNTYTTTVHKPQLGLSVGCGAFSFLLPSNYL